MYMQLLQEDSLSTCNTLLQVVYWPQMTQDGPKEAKAALFVPNFNQSHPLCKATQKEFQGGDHHSSFCKPGTPWSMCIQINAK